MTDISELTFPPLFLCLLLFITPIPSQAQNVQVADTTLNAIYNSSAPTFGSADGLKIVEFYDYQCGYCKSAEEGVRNLVREDGHIEIIYMDFPKLGPMSITASKATLASMQQGMDKYYQFHSILMNKDVHVSDDVIFQVAQYVGLDVGKLRQDMNDPSIDQFIQNSTELGRSAGVRITPSFIIGKTFFSGYLSHDQLKQDVTYIRTVAR